MRLANLFFQLGYPKVPAMRVAQAFGEAGVGSGGQQREGPADPTPASLAALHVLYVEEVLGRLFLHLQGGVLYAVGLLEEQLQTSPD